MSTNLQLVPQSTGPANLPVITEERREMLGALADMVVASLPSKESRRVYASRLRYFLISGYPLTREGVGQYLMHQRDTLLVRTSALNQTLAAIKKLACEAELRGLLSPTELRGITTIKSTRQKGTRSGNWLTLRTTDQLMNAPDRTRLVGKRDACLIAILLGCGLRREEAATLTWTSYQMREDRMCFCDIIGKGGRVRTVAIPPWAQTDIDLWRAEIQKRGWYEKDKTILRRMRAMRSRLGNGEVRSSKMSDEPLTAFGIWCIVTSYAKRIGIETLRPHDLRRTLARLMKKAGAGWDQIQYCLGHESIETTQAYVGGLDLDQGIAAVDLIKWGRK